MKMPRLSLPLYAALLSTLCLSLVTALWPLPPAAVQAPSLEQAPATSEPHRSLLRSRQLSLTVPAVPAPRPAATPATLPPQPLPLAPLAITPADRSSPATTSVPRPRFRYLGRLQEANRDVAFLASGDQNLAVSLGEEVDGAWRLDRLESGRLYFTHLPSGTTTTLEIAAP